MLPAVGADALYVIDLSGYVFRAYHAITTPLTSPSGEPTHATLGTLTMLERLIVERKPRRMVLAMDSRTPSFRKELYADYKATRPPTPPDLRQQMARCEEIGRALGLAIAQRDGVEADDVIATLVDLARAARLPVVIASADKDLMQLVGGDVVQWDTMRNKLYGPAEVKEKLGVAPERVRELLALTGDSSDNVPGVPSVGPKTATELLSQFSSIDDLYTRLDALPPNKKRLREALMANEASARLSLELVTLKRDVRLDLSIDETRVGAPDVPRLRALYRELGFRRQLAALPDEPASGAPPSSRKEPPRAAPAEVRPATTEIVRDLGALLRTAAHAAAADHVTLRLVVTQPDAMRAAIVGVGLLAGGRAAYVPLAHRRLDAGPEVPLPDALRALAPALARPLSGHDLKRDSVTLRRHGVTPGAHAFDAQLAAFLLDPEARVDLPALADARLQVALSSLDALAKPARGKATPIDQLDVDEVARLVFAELDAVARLRAELEPRLEEADLSRAFSSIELPISELLVDVELAGVKVDVARLAELGALCQAELAALEARAHEAAGHPFNLGSPRQLETVLFDELGLRVVKRTKTSRSTDHEVLEALSDDHALPAIILEHRQIAKLEGTYIVALPAQVNPDTGRVHTTFAQAVAATGRLSSVDPNLQNIPIRTELGRRIRAAFVAEPGHALVSADYSQIELRVLAHLSRDPVLVDAFTTGEDIHTRTAMEIFDRPADAVDADQRRAAKTINFGVIYGMGDGALAKRLGIPRKEAASFIDAYFKKYAGVRAFLDRVVATARATGSVSTLAGRRRFLPDLSHANRAVRLAAERVAQNTPIQGSAADLLKLAMIALREPPTPSARMILTVHDELVFEVDAGEVDAARAAVKRAMEGVMTLAVPLVVETSAGPSWSK
ncbi:MAG: DNA polymerase I [Polyangiaceae bacterium]|nr:DNA polymerase I [Polyangiaceae bacterium]